MKIFGWFDPKIKPRSIRTHLLALASGLIFPALVFATVALVMFAESERGLIEHRIQGLASDLATDIDRQIAARRTVLEALATSEALAGGDLKAFRSQAEKVATALGHRISLRDPSSGRYVFNTALDGEMQDSSGSGQLLQIEQNVVATKTPAVSHVIFTPFTKIWVTVVMIPIVRDGAVPYILQSAIPSSDLSRLLRNTQLDKGWISVLIDQNDTVIARSIQDDAFVGHAISARWREENRGKKGVWRGRNLDGVPVISAFARTASTPWIAAITVPVHLFNAPLMQALWVIVGFGATLITIALMSAYIVGTRISEAISSLARGSVSLAGKRQPVSISTPVTEINQVGLALATAEAHLQSIFRTVPDAMVVVTEDGTVDSFSATAESLFGYQAGEMIGRSVDVLFNENARRFFDECRLSETGSPQFLGRGSHLAGRRKNGSTFSMELAAGALHANGRRLITLFVRDVTDRERLERGLRRAQKMEAIGQLTGGIAHDFSNLLTVIIGNLEMWEDEPGTRPEHLALIRQAQEAAIISSQLTAQLLAFGRRQPLAPRIVDLGVFANTISVLIGRTLGDTIKTRTVTSGNNLNAFVDAPMLQNALLNLAINARDAMPDGGELTISVSESENNFDEMASRADSAPSGYVMLSISDTGCGMTPEVMQRAFEPFFTTKPVGAGTGLGLSMVYGFVKQSSGEIKIDSEPGRGTRVSVFLPRVDGKHDEAGAAIPLPAARPRGHAEIILVVEDDERVRRITTRRLKRLGYGVIEADNGPSALAIVEAHVQIDLLFTDIVMPGGMSGDELAARVQTILPKVKTLYSSGYADPAIAKRQLRCGTAWLRKPYTVSELARTIDRLLHEARSR